MKAILPSKSFHPRALFLFGFCSVGLFLAALGFAANPTTPGWASITSPNLTQNNALNAVTCASASDCWAVGYYSQPLILRRNGNAWAIVPSPSSSSGTLNSVSCASASDCWAAGGANGQTLFEHWDGASWTIVPSPNVAGAYYSYLTGVTCASASDCWAVGYYHIFDLLGNPHDQTLIMRWNGSSWSIVASPNNVMSPTNGIEDNYLYGVACGSPSQCWAVGYYHVTNAIGQYQAQTLIERWDGTSWSIVASPNINFPNDFIYAVTCTSVSDCWAIGNIIAHWDGGSWSTVPEPTFDGGDGDQVPYTLYGLTCSSASQCWAAGQVIEQWDGSAWSVVPTPGGGPLKSVTCASASDCWAVGSYTYPISEENYVTQMVIDKYGLTIPPLSSVASRMTHGGAGTFYIDLPLTGPRGVECRSGGANGNYSIVFSFVNNLNSIGPVSVSGTGNVSSAVFGPNANQYTVNLTGVADQQYVTVNLGNVLDSQNNNGNVATTMGVLLGDVNANGLVNSTDTTLVQAQSGKPVTLSNFRMDVNANGLINSTDTSAVQARSGHGLPPPPP